VVRSGTYAYLLAGAVSAPSIGVFGADLGLIPLLIGYGYRTTTVIPTNDTDFYKVTTDLGNILFRLRLKAVTGNVDLIDQPGNVVGTITAPFTANTQHFIEIHLTIATVSQSDVEVFIDNVSKISITNEDFVESGATFENVFTGDNVVTQDTYIDDVYTIRNPASVSERFTSFFNVPRAYQNTDEDATDLGSTLDAGTWALAGEVPVNETNVATYSTSNVTGGTTTDSPSTRLGPTGGPTLGTIKGAKWIFRLQRGTGSATTHSIRVGNSVDGLSDEVRTLTTAFANYFLVSESTVVPLVTESFQYGMKTAGAQDITAADIWAMIANVTASAPPRTPNAKDRAEII
jgi:hypothetical protein